MFQQWKNEGDMFQFNRLILYEFNQLKIKNLKMCLKNSQD